MIIKLEQVSYEDTSALMAVLSSDENRDSKGKPITIVKSATAFSDRSMSLVIEISDKMVAGERVEFTPRHHLNKVLDALKIFADTK